MACCDSSNFYSVSGTHKHGHVGRQADRQIDRQRDERGCTRQTRVVTAVRTKVTDVKLRCRAGGHAKQFKETVLAFGAACVRTDRTIVSRRKCSARRERDSALPDKAP